MEGFAGESLEDTARQIVGEVLIPDVTLGVHRSRATVITNRGMVVWRDVRDRSAAEAWKASLMTIEVLIAVRQRYLAFEAIRSFIRLNENAESSASSNRDAEWNQLRKEREIEDAYAVMMRSVNRLADPDISALLRANPLSRIAQRALLKTKLQTHNLASAELRHVIQNALDRFC